MMHAHASLCCSEACLLQDGISFDMRVNWPQKPSTRKYYKVAVVVDDVDAML